MRYIILALVLSCAVAADFLPVQVPQPATVKSAISDFVTGFALAARLAEKVPDALPCITDAQTVQKDVHAALALIHQGGFDNIVNAIELLEGALNDAVQGCGNASKEVHAYVAEVKGIISNPDFKHNAAAALYKYAEVVGRDVANIVQAKVNNDWLSAGIYAGDIARIIIWGEPNPQ